MELTLRLFAPDDLDALLSTWQSATRLAHPFLTEAFIEQEKFNIPNVYIPNAETWVVEQDGNVIGFLALIGNEIGGLFVRPDLHGTGAGWALMEKACQLHPCLEVEVFKENSIGRKFYDRCGFQLMHELNHEATGQMLLRMKLDQASA